MIQNEIVLSTAFKKQTKKAITAIVVFAVVYVLIVLLALALTAVCVYSGIMVIISVPRLITILLGIGLVSLGFLVMYFLLKFIFKSQTTDLSYMHEISKDDEPELFKLINDIVTEVGTLFPKKVYLSTEVNASVFYDSNFWSMFFPVKKNLHIGLGLVNGIHYDELKAILSHEFGHFSQRTMKVGSYVYNVNQIIFNTLNDNDTYDSTIHSLANVSGVIAVFVIIALKINQGIQWILQQLYQFVNKSYLGLSREMEFHADEIASHVTGFKPLKTALLRMNLIDHALNEVFDFYDKRIDENIKCDNLFKAQTFVMNYYAEREKIPLNEHLPVIDLDTLNAFDKSKLIIKNQWASHPSTEDRIKHLEQLNLERNTTKTVLANTIFKNIEATQQLLTNKLFDKVVYIEEPKILKYPDFKSRYQEDFLKNTFSLQFNNYYDNKNLTHFNLDQKIKTQSLTFSELFSDEKVNLVYESIALESDLETIKQIKNGSLKLKTFDYDGIKYTKKQVDPLIKQLEKHLKLTNIQISENDKRIYSFFKQVEPLSSKGNLKLLYTNFYEYDNAFDEKQSLYNTLLSQLEFVSQTTSFEQINTNFVNIKPLEEKLKEHIKSVLNNQRLVNEFNTEIKESLEKYSSQTLVYFKNETYIDANLELLFKAINNYAFALSRHYFLIKKDVLDYKEVLINQIKN